MTDTNQELIPADRHSNLVAGTGKSSIPQIIEDLGPAGEYVWTEFFSAQLRNRYTRAAYRNAVTVFLEHIQTRGLVLKHLTPGDVGAYMDQMKGSIPKKKLHLSAIRPFCDLLCTRHVMLLNPALSVRGDRYQPEGRNSVD
jgi:integrase/recombinase XerD